MKKFYVLAAVFMMISAPSALAGGKDKHKNFSQKKQEVRDDVIAYTELNRDSISSRKERRLERARLRHETQIENSRLTMPLPPHEQVVYDGKGAKKIKESVPASRQVQGRMQIDECKTGSHAGGVR